MSTKIISNEKATIVISVAAEKKAWEEAQAKGFQKVKSKLKMDGFRDGKSIPDALAKPHINPGEVINEAIDNIIGKLFEEACKENNITPFMQPDVKVTKVDEKELEIEFDIPLAPEVKLGSYKGHKAKLEKTEVTEEEIKNSVNTLIQQNANLKTIEGAAKLGDTVVLDFAGYMNGKPFDGGSAKEYSLELGSNSFVPGFEEQLVGTKAGDEKDVTVTFPTQYVKELAGKEALFKCSIKEVKEKVLPELNDDFVKGLGIEKVETVEQLNESKKAEILNSKNQQAISKQFNEIVKQIVEESVAEISEKMVQKEAESLKENMKKQIEQQGLTFEQYLEITNGDEKKLDADFKVQALNNIKTYLVMEEIAKVENLTVSDEDVENEMKSLADQYKMPIEQVKQILGQNVERLKDNLKQKKIEEFIRTNNNM